MAVSNYSVNLSLSTSEICFDLKNQIPIKLNDSITKIRETSLASLQYCQQVVDNFFTKIYKKYPSLNTIHIETLVQNILLDPSITPFVRGKTLLRDTWYHRFWQVKTSLGEILHELQKSQESPHREILNKDIVSKADKEAKILLKQLPKKENINKASKLTDKTKNKSQINLDQHKLLPTTTTPVKVGEEFQVNTYTTNDQTYSSVASLSNGKFIVVWRSQDQDGSSGGIYGQIFNADRTKNGDEFQINTYTLNSQGSPSVANLNNDQFVVTWDSPGLDGSGYGVYGQIYNANGTKSGERIQVNTYTIGYQGTPTVASLNNGKFVITWTSDGQDGSDYGIYGQIFNTNGSKSENEFQINTYTPNKQYLSSVASLNNDKFVVTWESYNQDGSEWGIYAQIFNANGTKIGNEFQVNTYTSFNQSYPTVTNLNNDQFVVTWSSVNQDGDSYGIYGQIFNANGTKIGNEFRINTYTSSGQSWSTVVNLNNDKFVVTWQSDNQDGSGYGIYGQIFNKDGTRNKDEFQINTYTFSNQNKPSVTSLNNGKFIVIWQSDGQDGSGYGIYGQILKDNTAPIVRHPIPNQTIEHNSLFTYTVLEDTFFDADGDALTYTATQTDGAPLPAWLSFNPTTKMFLGTPLNVGILSVRVTVSDDFGGFAFSNFTITSTNTAPIVQNPIPNQTIGHNDFFFYTIPTNTFSDLNGDALTYTAMQTNGSPLPEWLNFNPITRILSGSPNTDSFSIRIVASDNFGATAYTDFTITVVNMAPKVLHHIPDQKIEYGKSFSYIVKNNTFIDPDGDSLQFSANKCGAKDLPKWLFFDTFTKLFYGHPVDDDKGSYSICLTAKDKFQRTAEDKFTIKVTSSSRENLLLALKIIGIVGGALGGLVTCFGIYMKCKKKYKNIKINPPEAPPKGKGAYLILKENESSINN